jgi:predicted kinase
MSKLIVTRGLPASGKTTWAMGYVRQNDKAVAFSYDDARKMLKGTVYSGDKVEKLVRGITRTSVQAALGAGFDAVVHNTSLTQGSQDSWAQVAKDTKSQIEFKDFTDVAVDVCVKRDSLRNGEARVGRAVIETMALHNGLMTFDTSTPIVICDVDGTLADHEGVRSPYDESLVHLDKPHEVVVKWVRNLVHWGGYCLTCFREWRHDEYTPLRPCECERAVPAPEYQVIVVSGRSTRCAKATEDWLSARITYSHLFMRNRGDRRPDVEVKQEILNGILKKVPKEQIAFVIDDRPCVVDMWRSNGLRVFPARGAVEPF